MPRRTRTVTVRVGRMGGRVEEYEIEGENPTVGDALDEADISISKSDRIRMNGNLVDRGDDLKNNAIIMVSGKVAGA